MSVQIEAWPELFAPTNRDVKCVEDAALYLDEKVPGWHNKITKPLIMADPKLCVGGQVGGTSHSWEEYKRGCAAKYGRSFMGTFSNQRVAETWASEIRKRQVANPKVSRTKRLVLAVLALTP